MDLAFSCLVWSSETGRKAQTSIESLPEICCFADGPQKHPHICLDFCGFGASGMSVDADFITLGTYI